MFMYQILARLVQQLSEPNVDVNSEEVQKTLEDAKRVLTKHRVKY